MWTCANCGEVDNENTFKFCFSCGARNPADEELSPEERPAPRQEANGLSPGFAEGEPPQAEDHEHGFKLPRALTSLGQRFRHATSSAGDQIISVKISHEAQEAIELLLQAGRHDSQAEAAGFLLEEGVAAQAELLQLIREKLAEIERLRAELRGIGRGVVSD